MIPLFIQRYCLTVIHAPSSTVRRPEPSSSTLVVFLASLHVRSTVPPSAPFVESYKILEVSNNAAFMFLTPPVPTLPSPRAPRNPHRTFRG